MLFGNFGEMFSKNQEQPLPQTPREIVEPMGEVEAEEIKKTEISIRNLQLTMESNQRRMAHLELEKASIQIEYGSDPLHPAVKADSSLRSQLQAEIAKIQEETEILDSRLQEQLKKMRELRKAA